MWRRHESFNMKRIKTYTNFLNELISFKHKEEEPDSTNMMVQPNEKGSELAFWTNGILIINPTQKDMMDTWQKTGGGFGINMKVTPKKKTIFLSPIDDWADTKIILNVQKALKDMIKAKYIDDTWNCVIMDDKETERSIGSKLVKDIIASDFSYANKIPFALHGTSDYYLEEIKSKGIMPREESGSKKNWPKGYTPKSIENIYLTTDYDRAMYYAKTAVEALEKKNIKSKPIIVVVKDLPTSNIVVDDDLLNIGSLQLLSFLSSGKSAEDFAKKTSYITGIRNSGQFAWKGRIPASMITKIYQGEDL
jgi:hypothetical protein